MSSAAANNSRTHVSSSLKSQSHSCRLDFTHACLPSMRCVSIAEGFSCCIVFTVCVNVAQDAKQVLCRGRTKRQPRDAGAQFQTVIRAEQYNRGQTSQGMSAPELC